MKVRVGRISWAKKRALLSILIPVPLAQSAALACCPSALLHSLLSREKISTPQHRHMICVVWASYLCLCTWLTDKSSSRLAAVWRVKAAPPCICISEVNQVKNWFAVTDQITGQNRYAHHSFVKDVAADGSCFFALQLHRNLLHLNAAQRQVHSEHSTKGNNMCMSTSSHMVITSSVPIIVERISHGN